MLLGITILLAFSVLGDLLSDLLSLPIPGAVTGLILLVIVLQVRSNVPCALRLTSETCIRYMAVLFIPGCVGVFFLGDVLREQWLPITLAIFVATPVSLILTAAVMQLMLSRYSHRDHQND